MTIVGRHTLLRLPSWGKVCGRRGRRRRRRRRGYGRYELRFSCVCCGDFRPYQATVNSTHAHSGTDGALRLARRMRKENWPRLNAPCLTGGGQFVHAPIYTFGPWLCLLKLGLTGFACAWLMRLPAILGERAWNLQPLSAKDLA